MPIDISGHVIDTSSLAITSSFARTVVQDGLVFHVDAANKNSYAGSGTSWVDISPNARTATLTNGPTFNSANGGSIVFDGSNDYAEVGSSNAFGLGGLSAATMTIWLKATRYSNYQYVAGFRDDGDFDFFFLLLDSGGGSVLTEARLRTTAGVYDINFEYVSYFGAWTHIAFVFGNNRTELYLNGDLKARNTSVTGAFGAATNNFRIGTNGVSPAYYAKGDVASVNVYNRALHRGEILANYYATKDRF